jgi:hypothetical protein
LLIANQRSSLIVFIAFIYFYFQLPADVKFFPHTTFTTGNDLSSRLVSIAGVIGSRPPPSLAINATSKNQIF